MRSKPPSNDIPPSPAIAVRMAAFLIASLLLIAEEDEPGNLKYFLLFFSNCSDDLGSPLDSFLISFHTLEETSLNAGCIPSGDTP